MDLYERLTTEALADAFRSRLPATVPVDLEPLAHLAGIIDVTASDTLPEGTAATLIGGPIDGFYAVMLNRRDSPVRLRFSLAHEIAHRVLNPDRTAHMFREQVAARSERNDVERACDYFAACLLMPRALVNEYARSVFTAGELARRFQVSVPAMRARLRELGLHAMARS